MRNRMAIPIMLASLGVLLASHASAISISLSQVGGTFSPPVGSPSDTLVLSINVKLDPGDALTSVSIALDLNSCSGCSFLGGTEQAFNFVGGVLLTPMGAPGADIGPGGAPGTIAGWENQTLTATGAPGPATFSIGTASFHLQGHGTIRIAPAELGGLPTGTLVTGANFVDITDTVNIPEPTVLSLVALGLAGLAMTRRP